MESGSPYLQGPRERAHVAEYIHFTNLSYAEAYEAAQSVSADGRSREEPPMNDLRSPARPVRGYVSSNKRLNHGAAKENPTADASMRSSERKALATLGVEAVRRPLSDGKTLVAIMRKGNLKRFRRLSEGRNTRAHYQSTHSSVRRRAVNSNWCDAGPSRDCHRGWLYSSYRDDTPFGTERSRITS